MGPCLAGRSAGDGHAMALARGAADRRVDRPGPRGDTSPSQRQIDAFDVALLDLRLQRRVSGVRAGNDQKPAGVLVESVHDAGPLGVSASTKQIPEPIDERRALVRGRRVDDEPGRLVDHGEGVVDVDYLQLAAHTSCSACRWEKASSRTPAVTAMSAMLKAGQAPIWM